MKIVISLNDNKNFLPFLKLLNWYYTLLNFEIVLLLITNQEKIIKKYQSFTNLKIFNPIDKFDIGIQSKMLRHYYPVIHQNEEPLVITDADQFILNIDKLQSSIKTSKEIITFGKNFFDGTEEDGKTPMAPYITSPRLSKKLFKIDKDLTFEEFLFKISNINESIDGRESVLNNFNNFSDESLFRLLKKVNKVKFHNIDLYLDKDGDRRLDRDVFWNTKNPNIGKNFWKRFYLNKKQKRDLRNLIYFDVCPPRPPNKFLLKKILKTVLK